MFSVINLHLGDCVEILKTFKGNSIDFCITSPPYNMNLRIRNGKHCSRQIVKELSTKYESYPDNLPMDDYFNLNKKAIDQLLRVCGVIFYNVQFLTGNKQALYKLMGEYHKNIKEFIVWDKVNAQPAMSDGILNSRWEAVLVLSREDYAISRRFESALFNRGGLQNLWQIKRGRKIDSSHGAVFPEELVNTIINNFIPSGSTILDPFMGTGTTGAVSIQKKCRFIGIEQDQNYFSLAEKRITEQWREQ